MTHESLSPPPILHSEAIAQASALQLAAEAAAAQGNPEAEIVVATKQAQEAVLPGLSSVDSDTHAKLVDHFSGDVTVARNIRDEAGNVTGKTVPENGWSLKAVDMRGKTPIV